MTQFLFVSDLDHTLIGDDRALENLNHILQQHRTTYGTKIVYATGRSLFLYKQLTQEKNLLPPDGLITAVGTEVYFNPKSEEIDQNWANLLSQNWQREKILKITENFSELTPQPSYEQGEFKISFYLPLVAAEKTIEQLQNIFQQAALEVKLIYSGSKDLDIIPQQADKGLALKFIQERWQMNDEQTVVCGDSGNDIALFQTGKTRGILVGNAQPELIRWYQQNKTDYHYLAQENYAQGILEGLSKLQFIPIMN